MSFKPPFVSIVVQHRGHQDHVLRCLKAISRLNYQADRCEVILVDDGSEPRLKRSQQGVIDKSQWFNLDAIVAPMELTMLRQAKVGPAAAKNAGARHAHGNVLVFLDADCIPTVQWLTKIVARMIDEKRAVIGGRCVNLLARNIYCATNQMIARTIRDDFAGAASDANFLEPQNLGLLLRDFRSVGGFREGLNAAEEHDLCARLKAAGHRLVFAPEVVVRRRRELGFKSFVTDHFEYGRALYRTKPDNAGGNNRFGPRAIARQLLEVGTRLGKPFSKKLGARAPKISALLLLWQLAVAAGVIRELFSVKGHTRAEPLLETPSAIG